MKLPNKRNFLAFASWVFLFACNKTTEHHPKLPLSTKEIVAQTVGTYQCTRYCKQGSIGAGWTYDTAMNIPLVISQFNDSTLLVLGYQLSYYDTSNKQFVFHQPASGLGHWCRIDSSFTQVYFSYWDGGLGGGSGCEYYGVKQ